MIKNIFTSKNKPFLIQALIFTGFFYIAFVANHFPRDSFIVGGDFYQVINPASHLSRYFYTWFNQIGQGAFNTMWLSYPFYVLLALLDGLGLKSNIISGFYIFLQLYLSYLSFYLSIKFLYPNLSKNIRIGGGLVYALNNFTFTIFTYPWGFTHHFLFYIFVPPLLLIFLKILTEEKILSKYLIYFGAIFLVSTIAYNNLVFLILLFFVQFVLVLVFLFFKQIKLDRKFFIKVLVIIVIYILFSSYLIISQYSAISNVQKIYSNKTLGANYLDTWIPDTSNSFLNTFLLAIDKYRFPVIENTVFTFLSTAYLAIILTLLILNKKKHNLKNIIYPFVVLLAVFIFLSVRAYGPLKEIGLFIYKMPPFILFRSPEKIFLLLPFFYTVLLVGLLQVSNLKRKFIYLVFGILLIIPPFYTNKMYKILAGKDNSNSKYNYVVKIPKEYYETQNIINQDSRLGGVVSLPYSVVNSVNWSQYPMWNFIGQDILHLIYNKFYISANSYDHPTLETKLSFKEFNEKMGSSNELLSLIKKFNGIYVLYHKDIESTWIKASKHIQSALEELKQQSKIELIASNSYFDLYRLDDSEFSPLIDSDAPLSFERVNPTKYRISMNIKEKSNLEFNQAFDTQWKLYLKPNPSDSWCQKANYYDYTQITECNQRQKFFEGEELSYFWKKPAFDKSHELIKDYANNWTIDPEYIKTNYSSQYYKQNLNGSIDIELVIYFKTQNYFYTSMIIDIMAVLGFLGYLGWDLIRSRKKVFLV